MAMFLEILPFLMFIAAFAALLRGYPVAFSLAGVGLAFALLGLALGLFDPLHLRAFPQRIYGNIMEMDKAILVAVPLFVFMGVMLEKSRVAEELLEAMGALFGTLRGGLGISVVVVGALLAASTGIVGATVVTMDKPSRRSPKGFVFGGTRRGSTIPLMATTWPSMLECFIMLASIRRHERPIVKRSHCSRLHSPADTRPRIWRRLCWDRAGCYWNWDATMMPQCHFVLLCRSMRSTCPPHIRPGRRPRQCCGGREKAPRQRPAWREPFRVGPWPRA